MSDDQKPKKRATGKAKTGRRARIAAGIISAKSLSEIAREEQISREWASREANAPETRIMIASLLDRHSAEIEALMPLALHAIRESLSAAVFSVQKVSTVDLINRVRQDEVRIVEVGPDHYARLTGAKRFIELALAGRPAPKEKEDATQGGIVDLEGLRAAIASPLQ